MENEKIVHKLELARKELLDLSLKNPLLNYKVRVSFGLEIPFLNTSDVFNYLVNEGKKCTFTTEKTNNPSKLYTDLRDKDLHKKLIKTYRTSNTYIEERGANILFLALGFLKWCTPEDEETFYRAPLVLVPVEFKRSDNQDKFHIQYSGEEIRLNVSLITRLQNDFGIDINYESEDEIKGIDEYLRSVDEIITTSSKNTWKVETTAGAFDFFSYAKFLMYNDLDLTHWENNEILERLFVGDFSEKVDDANGSKGEFSPHKLYTVMDADSSQSNVIYQIQKGKNMVIQGPPGTGKSQSIANIIASCIANDKSVLFVAEKKAALDVVKTRLEKVGLGDLVLELHSHKTNKNDILRSIEHTINLGELKTTEDQILKVKYDESRKEIEQYAQTVCKSVAQSGKTLVDIYGNALALKQKNESQGIRLPRIKLSDDMSSWSEKEFIGKHNLVDEFCTLLKSMGKVEKHCFYGVELKKCLPYEQVAIRERILDMEECLSSLIATVDEIGGKMQNKSTSTIFEVNRLINTVNALDEYKDIKGVCLKDLNTLTSPELDEILQSAKEVSSFKKNLKKYKVDASNYYDYKRYIGLFDEYTNKDTEKERRDNVKLMLTDYFVDDSYSKEGAEEFYSFAKNIAKITAKENWLSSTFATLYQDPFKTDWSTIKKLLARSRSFLSLVKDFNILPQSKWVISSDEDADYIISLKDVLIEKRDNLVSKIEEFIESVKFNSLLRFGSSEWYYDMSFSELRKFILSLKNNSDSVMDVVRYNELVDKFETRGIKPILEYYFSTGKYDTLTDILENEYYDALINRAYKDNAYLASFKEYKYSKILESFRSMDKKLMVENIKYILNRHYKNMPKLNDTSHEMSILRRELQKKKNQIPVSKLFRTVEGLIQKIKPVFMMSPISVASFLPTATASFDIVIFDEASQVRPVEAFGALLRAKQVVVVGDSKQLPPTSFFDAVSQKYDDLSDEDYDVVNMESILSLLLSKNIPERTLAWHYRSRNQSLINMSNNEFYNHTLKVFPSVNDRDPNQGLVFRHVSNAVYERGGSRTNKKEAKTLMEEVFAHAKAHPEMSIGVVSFSLAQQEALYREFDNMRKSVNDPVYDNFFSSEAPEPFFIKNLESVQGDERDVIFISIGYGFDEEGKLSMDFGALNKEGGERRLNVLITRAKYKCIVYSNFTSHDINLSRTSSVGVLALKRFLEYAQDRIIFISKNQEVSENSFVDYLYNSLSDYGYEIDRKIGSNVGIDLAIYDKKLDRFTVAIECDGGSAFTMSLPSDRERIRVNVLKSLGWKIYHVFPPDFYRNPRNEFSKILDFIEDATQESKESGVQKQENVQFNRKQKKMEELGTPWVEYKPYKGAKQRVQIFDDTEELSNVITRIVKAESPLHKDALNKTLIFLTNSIKLTPEQKENIESAMKKAMDIKVVGDFLYDINQQELQIRNRENVNKVFKKAEFVSPEEYIVFIKTAIERGDAILRDDLYKLAPEYLGIPKNNYVKSVVDSLVEKLVEEGELSLEKDMIYINDEISD